MKKGEKGEGLAAAFLRQEGYQIIKRNYRTPIGEIDIIALDKDTLVFIEVKARESIRYGHPFEAVDRHKQRKLANVAQLYLKRLKEIPSCRFDVISVYQLQGEGRIELIKDAFDV